jgi:ATP-dependent Clp endopeptidase proteolytic subunit ClpP
MPELPDLDELRARTSRIPPPAGREWFRIQAKDGKDGKKKTADVWIFDTIGRSWSDEGTDAKSFARKLAALDVEEIMLHLNTPGGDAFDGVAIYNALKDHKARVTTIVEGLAASAGSFIAQSGDRIRMNRAATMMIHDASGIVIGNAGDMADFAEVLNKISDSIAGIYASRAGGAITDWRAAMSRESWYTAAEAVAAGLADEAVEDQPAEPPARASWDLSVFAYAGRQAAPAPPVLNRSRTQPPAPPEPPQKGAGMDPAKLREALGLPAAASDDEVRAAWAKSPVGTAPSPQPPNPPPGDPSTPPPPPPDPSAPPPEPQPKPQASASGVMMVDPSAWEAQQERIRRLEASQAKSARDERDKVIAEAIKDGKFSKAREEHWRTLWDKDPEGTSTDIGRLAKNMVPIAELGHADAADDDAQWAEFDAQFPPHMNSGGGGRG